MHRTCIRFINIGFGVHICGVVLNSSRTIQPSPETIRDGCAHAHRTYTLTADNLPRPARTLIFVHYSEPPVLSCWRYGIRVLPRRTSSTHSNRTFHAGSLNSFPAPFHHARYSWYSYASHRHVLLCIILTCHIRQFIFFLTFIFMFVLRCLHSSTLVRIPSWLQIAFQRDAHVFRPILANHNFWKKRPFEGSVSGVSCINPFGNIHLYINIINLSDIRLYFFFKLIKVLHKPYSIYLQYSCLTICGLAT